MSLKRMLEQKTESIVEASRAETRAHDPARRSSVTAPGALFGLREDMNRSEQRVAELEAELGRYAGALPARRLDPTRVRPSHWANRHATALAGPAFEALKADIAAAGGNVQPIKVRPVAAEEGETYEIVYGHRRHRACAELGLEVLAVIAPMDDQTLFAEMDRENRAREDLTPYELALHYKQALDEKLWPSQSQLAAALGVTQGFVSQVLAIAELPQEVLTAFASPLEIQVRWGVALAKRLKSDPERMRAAGVRLRELGETRSAREVFEALMEEGPRLRTSELKVGGKRVATVTARGDRVSVHFERGAVPTGRVAALERLLREFLQAKS